MPTELTATERSQRARIAAYAMHSRNDGTAITAEARRRGPGNLDYWLDRVDPDRTLSERERHKRANAAKSEYFTRLSYRAARARRAKAARRNGEAGTS